MVTKSKEKIDKARKLLALVEQRREIERQEAELKEFFKDQITDGVLDAGDIVVLVEQRQRVNLDRKGLEAELGKRIKEFEKVTEYSQITVQRKGAA